jgi:hypothetical protein
MNEVPKVSNLIIAEIENDSDLNNMSDWDQKKILGGRLPNETEITIVLALDKKNPAIARQYTGDLLADRPTAVNIAVVLGDNNKVGQVVA